MNGNGQNVHVDPQAVIDRLLRRIAQLEFDVALKDAYIADLDEAAARASQEAAPAPEEDAAPKAGAARQQP